MNIIQLVAVLCLPSLIVGEEIKINGFLDLDTNAIKRIVSGISELAKLEEVKYENKKSNENVKKDSIRSKTDDNNKDEDKTTKGNDTDDEIEFIARSKLFAKAGRKVKDEVDLVEFINYVYEKSAHMLLKFPGKISTNLRSEFAALSEIFKEKFKEFYDNTLEQVIYSDLAVKNVALNTIDSADNIMQRIKNAVATTLKANGALKKDISEAIHKLQDSIDYSLSKSRNYLCEKFGYCNTSYSYINLLITVLELVSNSDKSLVREFIDAILSEILNEVPASAVTENQFNKLIELFDSVKQKKDADLRMVLRHITHNLKERHKPMAIQNRAVVLETQQAFYEIADLLEENIPPIEGNKKIWIDIKDRLKGWTRLRSVDIRDIIRDFVQYTKSKGIDKLKGHQWVKFKKNIGIILSNTRFN